MVDFAKLSAELKASGGLVAMMNVRVDPKMVIDFETYSEMELRGPNAVGATVYAQHSSTEILCMSYRDHTMAKAKIWVPGREPFPQVVINHILAGGFIEAHNAGFEQVIWKYVLMGKDKLNLDVPWPKKWKDTQAVCAYRALPLKLEDVGNVLNLPTKKDKRGKYLLSKLSKPQKPTKKNPDRINRDPALLEELYAYCCQDSDTEWDLGEMIGDLPPSEYKLWILDQKINARGIHVDTDAVNAALKIVDIIETKLTIELRQRTDNRVGTANELEAMKDWLRDKGYGVSDLTADTLERILTSAVAKRMPEDVRRVLEIRQTLARASTKKLHKYLSCLAADGRIHGLLQYHGASTGRWAGRLLQPQNFPRGDEAILDLGIELLIEMIKTCDVDLIDMIYGDPMEAIASALRGMIIADEGNTFYVEDFSAIEARVTAWLFGEEWKLQAFRDIDAGLGYKGSDDVYCASAAMVYNRPIKKKDKFERQVGKMCELAFGYQGGVGAWRNFDKRQPGDKGYVEDEKVDEYKNAWRAAHPNIVSGWWGLEEAAVNCVRTGEAQYYSYVTYEIVNDAAGKWLTCRLPNGRRLWYYNPQVESYEYKGRLKWELSYEGKDNKRSGRWGRITTYGGMLTENVVQAISRDLMVEAMIRVELAGYPIVLTIHDEIVSETKIDFGSLEQFARLMSIVPEWAGDCPIHCAGWTGPRYHKA